MTGTLTFNEAVTRIQKTRPKKSEAERLRQRSRLQQELLPLLPPEKHGALERTLNDWFLV